MDFPSLIERYPIPAIGIAVALGVLLIGAGKNKQIPATPEPVDQSVGQVATDNTALNNAMAALRAEFDQKLAAQADAYQQILLQMNYGSNTGTQLPPGVTGSNPNLGYD